MPLDIQKITAAVFNRLKLDAQGAPVRSLLTAGAAGVIRTSDLYKPLPTRPFVALQRMSAPGAAGLYRPAYRWFIYDDQPHGHARIEALAAAIARAYPSGSLSVLGHAITTIEAIPGPQATDATLGNLPYSFVHLDLVTGA